MAAGEGFEPSHTESESAVLPLHNPAILRCSPRCVVQRTYLIIAGTLHLSTGNFKKIQKKIKSLNFCDDSMQKGDFEDKHPGTWMPEDTAKRNPLDRCISLRDT